MKSRIIIPLSLCIIAALGASCQKNDDAAVKTADETVSGSGDARVNINIGSITKSTVSGTADDRLQRVEVFIFDADANSNSYGMLESYTKVNVSNSENTASAQLNATAGAKNIYVVANAGSSLASAVNSESSLKAAVSEFSANAPGGFIMIGSSANTLASGNNNISVSCRRIVSKISLQTIQGAFESSALQAATFTVDRIFLMNVPKQAKYVNGDVSDAFGSGPTALSAGSDGYPSYFVAASEDNVSLPYYKYAAPSESASEANGFYNFTFNSTGGMTLSSDSAVKAMTWTAPSSSDGTLYPGNANNHAYAPGLAFYTYPNPSAHSSSETVADKTTKLVLETSLTISGDTRKYYYSISIPYTQPNYHYTINNITIKRLGSEDPSLPVTKAACSFTITVKDWESGTIVGQYNNQTSSGGFEF